MTGRMYNERLGKLHFWLTFVSFNVTFFPMHWVGLVGMPRRVADYADRFARPEPGRSRSRRSSLGASVVVFFYNMISAGRAARSPSPNPWRAMTLEWQVSSPPPVFNFDEIPQVVGGPYEYGVPGARHAILTGGGAPRLARGGRRHERARRGACTAHDHHGPPTANHSSRIDPTILGMFLFIGSEAMLFGSFFAAYFFVRVVNPDAPSTWPPPPYEFPIFVAGVNTAILVTSSFTMHWATAVDQAEQPQRPAGGARAHDPDGHGVPADPVHRVRPRRLQHERRRVRVGLLRPHGAPRRPRLRRPHAAHDRRRCARSAATSRRSTITASRFPGSTGTSST